MRCFGMLLDGRTPPTGTRRHGADATVLIVMNSHHDLVEFTLSELRGDCQWELEVDTNRPLSTIGGISTGDVYGVTDRSLLLFARQGE